MISKEQAIAEIVILTNTHQISLEELTSVLGRQQIDANKKDAFTLTRLFSYLGGIFILFGLSAYIAVAWDNLNSPSRILITLGTGITCLILAVTAALQNKREKNVTVLVSLSAILQAIGLFVAVHELVTGGGDVRIPAMVIFGVLSLQYGVLFLKLKRTSLLFFAIYFATASFVSLADLINIAHNLIEFTCGVSLLAISYGVQRTTYNSICGFGYFVGSITLLWMSFDLLSNTPLEILYLGIVCFMLYISTIVRSRSILAISVIAMFSYLSYFTREHFLNSIGWPVCLILLGFIFFGISSVALKISKRFNISNETN